MKFGVLYAHQRSKPRLTEEAKLLAQAVGVPPDLSNMIIPHVAIQQGRLK